MYVLRTIMARSRNHCCKGKATMRYVYFWATCHCQQYKNTECCTKMFYSVFISPAAIKSS